MTMNGNVSVKELSEWNLVTSMLENAKNCLVNR